MPETSALLIIGGGISAYKSLELIRRLKERKTRVRAIVTRAGTEFVTPLSVSALTGESVFQDLFNLTDEAQMGHIQLSRAADIVVVAPATADLMAKLAGGHADDLASTALLATDKPVLLAPAMNVRMWNHPSTQRNLARLREDGIFFVGPNDGDMACGEFGPGRMAEPAEIVAAIDQVLARRTAGPLNGVRALITAGPTHERLDPVRYLANRSSGKQGYAIASAFAEAGAETILVSGPVDVPSPPQVRVYRVESAREMMSACESVLPVDVAVCAAAVADWRPDVAANTKIKKRDSAESRSLNLVANPDVLATIAHSALRPSLVVGFAAETDDIIAHAKAKLEKKGCDWIVANDVSTGTGIMGGDRNRIHLITRTSQEDWPELDKSEVGRRLVARVAAALKGQAA